MQRLRAVAQNQKLDMTDALGEMAGSGYERNMGVMDKNRFRSTLAFLFKGAITEQLLLDICARYKAGHPDPNPQEPDGYSQVKWKLFALDFDEIPLPAIDDNGELLDDNGQFYQDALFFELQQMRTLAVSKRLDMTDAFEEYSGSLKEKNTGIMTKNRFRSTMGTLFRGNLKVEVLNEICRRYGTGDPDPLEPGSLREVRWKQFARDFDEVPLPPPPPLPDPTPEIIAAMRDMNAYCDHYALDLAHEFEEYMGGKDKCTSDLMPRNKFCAALGVLLGKATSLYRLEHDMLDKICDVYAGGERNARDPKLFESVQWREFANDVYRVAPSPYLDGLGTNMKPVDVITYPQVGALGDPDDTDASRIAPVCGSNTCSSSVTISSMDLGYGKGGVKFGGPPPSRPAGKPAGGGGASGTQRTGTQRSTSRGGGAA